MTKTQASFDFHLHRELRADFLRDTIFGAGVRLLCLHGGGEASARAFLGKRASEIGQDALARAVCVAVCSSVIEPRSYLAACGRSPPTETTGNGSAAHSEVWWDDDDFSMIDLQLAHERSPE